MVRSIRKKKRINVADGRPENMISSPILSGGKSIIIFATKCPFVYN